MKLARALLGLCLLSSPAWAADHLMRVGEVMLSHGGMTDRQFIEIEDNATEPFPETYGLQIYDAAGADLGLITLTLQASVKRYTIATTQAASALGFTPDQTLTIALPTNGQACFRRLGGTVGNIHCLRWGTITSNAPASTSDMGPSPTDGKSLQRYMGYHGLEDPTPGEANIGVIPDAYLPDGPTPDAAAGVPDGGGGGGGDNSGDGDDGCSVGGGASWFGLAMLAMLAVIGRAARRRA